jgi:hypothetical protein
MSIHIMSAVWKNSVQTGGNLLLLLAMADFANDDGECWPSVATLATKARITDRHVRRILRQLEEDGEIKALDKPGQNGTIRYLVFARNGGEDKMSGGVTSKTEPRTPMSVPPDAHVSQSVNNHQEPKAEDSEIKAESKRFVEWFLDLLKRTGAPEPKLTDSNRAAWADVYEKMVRIDQRTKDEIKKVCQWARRDSFWSANFLSPAKLRQKNRDLVLYFDVFLNRMQHDDSHQRPNGRGFSDSNVGAFAELDRKMASGY